MFAVEADKALLVAVVPAEVDVAFGEAVVVALGDPVVVAFGEPFVVAFGDTVPAVSGAPGMPLEEVDGVLAVVPEGVALPVAVHVLPAVPTQLAVAVSVVFVVPVPVVAVVFVPGVVAAPRVAALSVTAVFCGVVIVPVAA